MQSSQQQSKFMSSAVALLAARGGTRGDYPNVLSGTLSIRKSLISSCLDTHQIGRKLQAFLVLVKKLIVD